MKKLLAIIFIAGMSYSCAKETPVSEDVSQTSADVDGSSTDSSQLNNDDSTALQKVGKKFDDAGNSLEGENDPANQGEFEELKKKK